MKCSRMLIGILAVLAVATGLAQAQPMMGTPRATIVTSPDIVGPNGGVFIPGGGIVVSPPTVGVSPYYRGPRWGYGNGYSNPHYYVVAVRHGSHVAWYTYSWTYQVQQKLSQLQDELSQTRQFNADAAREVSRLKYKVYALKTAMSTERDTAKSQALQGEYKQLQDSITAANASVRPPVQWAVGGPFTRYTLDNYLAWLIQASRPYLAHPAMGSEAAGY